MELRLLRQFVAVAEERHFTRAAERLGMAQPPLTMAIQKLEAELGATLFARTHRRVDLTPAGEALYPEARAILAHAEQLPILVRRVIRGEIGTLRLSFVSTASFDVLPSLLARVRGHRPDIDIQLAQETTDVQIERLLGEEIDAGIALVDGIELHPSLASFRIASDRLVAAIPTGWEIAEPVAPADMVSRPLVIFPRTVAPALHDAITGWLAAAGESVMYGQGATQMQTIVGLVAAGFGYAIVPASVRTMRHPGVRFLDLAGDMPHIGISLVWRRRNPNPALRETLRAIDAGV